MVTSRSAKPLYAGSNPVFPSITRDKEIDLLIHTTNMCLCNKYYNEVYKNISALEKRNIFFNAEDKDYQEWLRNKGP